MKAAAACLITGLKTLQVKKMLINSPKPQNPRLDQIRTICRYQIYQV